MKLHFEAKKHSYRQTQDGVVVSFVMHPNEVDPEFAASPLGTRFMVALAEIGEDEQPTESIKAGAALLDKMYKSDAEPAVVTRAVMLCKDPVFQRWVAIELNRPENEDGARSAILAACGIKSRSELKDNVDARMKLYTLITRFESETGRMAERR